MLRSRNSFSFHDLAVQGPDRKVLNAFFRWIRITWGDSVLSGRSDFDSIVIAGAKIEKFEWCEVVR